NDKKLGAVVYGATCVDDELLFAHAGTRVFGDRASGSVDKDSLFWICSHTKFFVSIAALQLVERGKIELDDPQAVGRYIPQLANPLIEVRNEKGEVTGTVPAKNPITLRTLLNHSSGLQYPLPKNFGVAQHYAATYDPKDKYDQFMSYHLKFEPGTDFAYGFSVDCIGFIVEKITGLSLHEYVQENICKPLGIQSTFVLTDELKSKLVEITFRRDGELERWNGQCDLINKDLDKLNLFLGGIGMYSSVKDFLTLLRHILQVKARRAVNPILKPETVDNLFKPSLPPLGAESIVTKWLRGRFFQPEKNFQWSFGLCLNTVDWPGRRRKWSGFWYGYAGTAYFLDPEAGVAAMIGTQSLPTVDVEFTKLWWTLEEMLYEGLGK
ncbi:hypothetical protein AMATHDRAFT_144010, partial [Amanita thiersii Skay4041]